MTRSGDRYDSMVDDDGTTPENQVTAQRSTIEDVRRFDPHRTPQELQPAKVPTVTMFGIGTLAWMAVLLVLGARHVLGYGVYGPMAGVAVAGILLGVGGMLWGSTRGQKGGSATGLPPAKTTTQQPGPTTPQSERPAQEPDRPGRQSERAPESGADTAPDTSADSGSDRLADTGSETGRPSSNTRTPQDPT